MPTIRRALWAATLGGLAIERCAAQSCTGTTTLSRAPSGCPTWTGDIVIPTGAPDAVELNGLERIEGNLQAEGASELSSLSSDSLESISGSLNLSTLWIISQIEFPELTAVGDLAMQGLPNLQDNTLLRTLQKLSSLLVRNTGLEDLSGFSLQTMEFVEISNNAYLQSITLQPYNITGAFTVFANGRTLDFSMPNLQSAQNISFSNCTSIRTPSLEQSFSMVVSGNYMDEFNGAPLLREVDGGLSFVNNQQLTRIALPELTSLSGGLYVQNNSKLEALDELYSLETVNGAVVLDGPLENVTLQGLSEVTGAFVINSTQDVPCDRFDEYYTDGLVKGRYECTTGSDASDSSMLSRASTSETSTDDANTSSASSEPSGSGGSGGLSKGARIGIGIGVGGGVGALCGLIVGLIFHYRAKRRKTSSSQAKDSESAPAEKDGDEVDRGVMLGNETMKHELEQPLPEAGTGKEAAELPATHGTAELDRSASTKGPAGVEGRHEMPAEEVKAEKNEKS